MNNKSKVGIAVFLGAASGFAIGVGTQNIGGWIGIGTAIGAAIGLAITRAKLK